VEFLLEGRRVLRVNVPSAEALFDDLGRRLSAGEGFTVATLNLDHLVKLRWSEAFRRAYLATSHVVADGNPVVWLSRVVGRPVSLVPGSEIVEPLCALAARQDVPVALFGSTAQALDTAAVRLTARHPGLRVVLCLAPAFGFDPTGPEADAAVARIKASGAGLVLVALGAPKQECFAVHARSSLPGVGFVSVGAGIDFIAGTQSRAPGWMRALAMEWVWRMLSNPRRLARRYMECALLLPPLAMHGLRRPGEPVTL
jgi:exopolysaccharide biosynthesis WecB/TagA/CpsF family protein